ncbi:hypothetical protein RFI_09483 [Reticulomyxa filosa]|uniref:Uncharacterized protein n=1 Tax=Reticulomyxa filosa TaxID=46433 RepID=X6NNY3_RETFI|nr:hypothetical protein RFI_09483 [Reticulomyxa filosa]|eukprot:ETO27648.1 hypothetical protein RFI_09483 [Reticulomyxa filosa]
MLATNVNFMKEKEKKRLLFFTVNRTKKKKRKQKIISRYTMWSLGQLELRLEENLETFRREFNSCEDAAVKTIISQHEESKRQNPFVVDSTPFSHSKSNKKEKKGQKRVEVIYLDEDADGKPITHNIPTEQEQMYIKAFDSIRNERLQTLFLGPIYDYSGSHQCSIYYTYWLLQKYNLHFVASFYSLSNAENIESQHRFCMLTRLLSHGTWHFADQLAVLDLIQVLTTCPKPIAYKLGWLGII